MTPAGNCRGFRLRGAARGVLRMRLRDYDPSGFILRDASLRAAPQSPTQKAAETRHARASSHRCPARFLLEKVHDIDSAWVQVVTNHLNSKRINVVPHQNIVFHSLLKQIPWATFDRLVDGHDADWDDRAIKSRAHLIAMLYG